MSQATDEERIAQMQKAAVPFLIEILRGFAQVCGSVGEAFNLMSKTVSRLEKELGEDLALYISYWCRQEDHGGCLGKYSGKQCQCQCHQKVNL